MIDYINYAYSEEVTYWRKAALESILTNSEEKKINRISASKVSLIWKVKIVKTVSIYGISFLKSKYLAYNEESRIFNTILSEEPSFEVMTGYFKVFAKNYQRR